MNLKKICCIIGTITLGFAVLKVLKSNTKNSNSNPDPHINEEILIEENKTQDHEEILVVEHKTENNFMHDIKEKKRKVNKHKRKSESTIEIMKSKLKPNFFLGFQVGNNEIHKKVKLLQEKIIKKNPLLHSAIVNVSTLHVTLAVTCLEREKDIKTLKDKLDIWASKEKNLFFKEPIVLNFTGIQTFNNVVAYVDIEKGQNYEKLCTLSKNLNDLLASADFTTDNKAFNPHLTILKLSKDIKLLKSKKKFTQDFESLKECTDHFGKQEIAQIQLLSMNESKDEKGYYKCFHQIDTSETVVAMDHTECCIPIPKPSENKS